MNISKEQPQFNMSAVFTSHRGPGESSTTFYAHMSPPPTSSTPEPDAIEEVMKMVGKNDAYDEDEEEDRGSEPNPTLSVNETTVNGGMDRQLHESFSIGDPPSLLPSQFSRTLSTPLFSSTSGMGLGGIGSSLTPQQGSRLTPPSDAPATTKDDLFHFGGAPATLSTPGGANPLTSSSIDTMSNIGLFGSALVPPHVESKPYSSSLGQGFSLNSSPPNETNSVFASSAAMPFHLVPLGSLSSTGGTSSSAASSASSSPPQLLFPPQPQMTPKLQPPQVPTPIIQPQAQTPIIQAQPQVPVAQSQPSVNQPQLQQQIPAIQPSAPAPVPQSQPQQGHSSPTTTTQTHFVGTAAVFVPKSMMTTTPPPAAQAEVPTTGGVSFVPHKEFGSYPHPGMFNAMGGDSHAEMSYPPGAPGFGMDSSSPPQMVNGMGNNNYRTKVCWYYVNTGHCQKGDRCNFSHHVPSPNVPGMYLTPMPSYGYTGVPDAPMSGSPRTMDKANGMGPFGVPPNAAPNQAPPPPQVVQPQTQPTSSPNFVAVQQLYRTKPCRFFFEKGSCLKGDRCNFSHDPVYAAAYADANPNSGFQMPDMSRFTSTSTTTVSVNNGTNIPSTNGRPNGTTTGPSDAGLRGGSRHPPTQSAVSATLPPPSSVATSRLSSASEEDFPPLA